MKDSTRTVNPQLETTPTATAVQTSEVPVIKT